MSARTIAVADGSLNTVIKLVRKLGTGHYLGSVTAADRIGTERLVIEK